MLVSLASLIFYCEILTEERSVALAPPKIVKRCSSVFRDDFNGAFNPNGWDYEVSMYGGYVRIY